MAEPFDDPFDDQPLVRSLREPGTPGELAEQDHYLAMFRATRGDGKVTRLGPGPRRPGGRAARRLGVGTTLSIAFAVAGGGVAAAYTAHLPEPIQQFAHEVLGPVNVPAPVERRQDRVTAAPEPDPSPSAQQTPEASPSAPEPTAQAEVSKPGDDQDPSAQASATFEPSESTSEEPDPTSPATSTPTPTPTPTPTSTPTSSPTPTPSPTATATSTPTPVVPTAASLTIAGTTHRVEYAAAPVFSGVVLDDEELGVPDVEVALLQRQEGAWRRVAFAMTDEDGAVTMSAPPIYENTAMRLKTKGAMSQRWRVSMHPELRLSPTVETDTVTIVATAVGGHEGDVVRLTGPRDGQRVTLALGLLGPDGTVTFQVEQPTRRARYGALIEATDEHTADKGSVVVVKPKPPTDDDGDGEGDPSPSP